jgi:hypothetical protein
VVSGLRLAETHHRTVPAFWLVRCQRDAIVTDRLALLFALHFAVAKNNGKHRYCSTRCRVAAHRARGYTKAEARWWAAAMDEVIRERVRQRMAEMYR